MIAPEMFIGFSKRGEWEWNIRQWARKISSSLEPLWKCQIWITAMRMPDGPFLCCLESPLDWSSLGGHRGVKRFSTVPHGRYDLMLLLYPHSMGGPSLDFILPPISTKSQWFMQLSASTSSAPSTTGELWVCWQKWPFLHLLLWG